MEWQDWLEKEDKEIKKKPTMFPRIRREFEDEKDEDPMVYNDNKKSWESWLEKDAMDGKQGGSPKDEEPERDYLKEFHDEIKRIKAAGKNDPKRLAYLKDQEKNPKRMKKIMDSNNLIDNYSDRLNTNVRNSKHYIGQKRTLDDLGDETNVELGNVKDFAMGNEGYHKKSWEVWLEKGRWDNPKHDTNTQKEFEAFEKLSKLPKNEVTELGDAIDEAIEGVKSGKLKKNNAIETSHKKDEKKDEWDGKFSSSTIRDDVKDDDDKAVSEEESLEELTDGKLEEVEKLKSTFKEPTKKNPYDKPYTNFKKLSQRQIVQDFLDNPDMNTFQTEHVPKEAKKSWEAWLEKDAQTNRWIETIRKKPTHNSMEDSQSFTRQQTGARYDQDNANKRSAPNSKWDKLGDLGKLTYKEIMDDKGNPTGKYVKNQNAGGSKSNALAHGNKERQRKASTRTDTPPTGNAPTGVRKSWEIWLEKDALNPDSKDKPSLMNTQRFARISTEVRGGNAQGGKLGDASLRGMRAEEKKRGKKYKWKNPNRKGRGGAKKELYHGTERQDGHYPALGTDSGSESGKKFDKLFQEKKSWESWLNKNEKWDKDEKEHDKHIKHGKSKKDAIADMKALHRHLREEKQRDDDIETNEIIGDVKNPILAETQNKPRPTPSIMPKNLTHKKPKYVKGVEQKGDVADERGTLNIQIADSMKSWEGWLEKMQGAGDARFGNQHLTGLDQKPVDNEEDEANILPEKEEKTDKKEEKQEETDNKPYKALGGE